MKMERLVENNEEQLTEAIINGINAFCSEVLVEDGLLCEKVWKDKELHELKEELASEIAQKLMKKN